MARRRGRDDDREVAEPQRRARRVAGCASARSRAQISAATVSSSRRGSGAGKITRLPSEVSRAGGGRARGRGSPAATSPAAWAEARIRRPRDRRSARRSAVRHVVEQPDVVASRPPPECRAAGDRQPRRRRADERSAARRTSRIERQRQLPLRAARREARLGAAAPARRQILPELAAGVEGVDVDLHRPGQRREDAPIELGAERHAEDVDRGRKRGRAGLQRGLLEVAGEGDRAAPGEHPLPSEQRQPELTLPALQGGVGAVGEAPFAPGGQHVGAREGVAVEQLGERARELDAAPVTAGPFGVPLRRVAQISPHRLEIARDAAVLDRGRGRAARARSPRGRRS